MSTIYQQAADARAEAIKRARAEARAEALEEAAKVAETCGYPPGGQMRAAKAIRSIDKDKGNG